MTSSPGKARYNDIYAKAPSSRDGKTGTAAAAAAAAVAASSSPSKKKIQMKKTRLPEVGPTIRDIENNVVHITGQLLGQGGFARVYQVQDPTGKALAFKAIMKDALLHQRKNRQKVLAEILIHRSLNHPNIVNFIDLFQDDANIYFKLELCSNGSMNDMVRTRGRCLDEEARFYMVQILAGTKFMHVNHVIHRDLKLGNIFFDANMNTKIGDFGLAALLKDPEERKKTMCGTPNYIAPEILYEGNRNGHSFEVDIWSVGVILYTLLAGKPPFQTSSVPAIYEKIRKNEYTIPDYVHPEACDLIKSILTPDPSQRPSLVQIMNHPWFTAGAIPLSVPPTATKATPHLVLPRTREESLRNFATVKRLAGWRDDADDEVEEEEQTEEQRRQSAKEKRRAQERAEEDRERMDKEFENAIQPGSSLAGFLQLGRKSLVKAPESAGPLRAASFTGLSRQLSALSLSRQHSNAAGSFAAVNVKGGQDEVVLPGSYIAPVDKENAGLSPTARMMPPPATSLLSSARSRPGAAGNAESAEERRALGHKARLVAAMANNGSSSSLASTASQGPSRPDSRQFNGQSDAVGGLVDVSSLDSMIANLDRGLDAIVNKSRFVPSRQSGVSSPGPSVRFSMVNEPDALNGERLRPQTPRSYIICWLDEMDKYGLGYALSDGSVGVYLKDDSSITTNAMRSNVEHLARLHQLRSSAQFSSVPQRTENYAVPTSSDGAAMAVDGMPRDVLRKYKVLKYFEQKINARIDGLDLPLVDRTRTNELTFVWRWYRCLQAIVFRFSNSMVQFNFYDHTKLFFSHDGQVISAIMPDRITGDPLPMRSWTLEEFTDIAEKNRSTREQNNEALPSYTVGHLDDGLHAEDGGAQYLAITTADERKWVRSLVAKVRYARDTMVKIAAKDQATLSAALVTNAATSTVPSRTRSASTATNGQTTTISRSNSGQNILRGA
jgi:polo-like kinase 1